LAATPTVVFATQVVAKSPAIFNLLQVLEKSNVTVNVATTTSITITASNSAGTSLPSTPINLVPLSLPIPTNIAQAFLDLCPVAQQAQAALYGQPQDPANQCAWQAQQAAALVSSTGSIFGANVTTVPVPTTNAASVAAPTHLLFALVVAVFLAAFRF